MTTLRDERHDVLPALDAIVESVTDPYVLGDPVRDADGTTVDFLIVAANRAAVADVGLPTGLLVGRRARAIFPGDFGDQLIRMIAQVLETGAPLKIDEYPYPSFHDGGRLHRYDVRASAVGDRLVFTWRDVTERLAERDRFRSMISASADAVLLLRDGVVEWTSPGIRDLLGWDPDEVTGVAGDQLVHPFDRARLHEARADGTDGIVDTMRLRYLRGGGGHVWCEARAAEVVEPSGDVVVVVSLRDVTDGMEVEAARDRSESQYRLVAENVSDVVYTTDRMFCFNWVSPSVTEVLGWTPAELIGRPTSTLQLPEDAPLVAGLRSVIFGTERGPVEATIRYRTKAGGFRWMSVQAHPADDGSDDRMGVVVALRDVHAEVVERRATDTLTAGNALLAQADDERELLTAMCDTAVQVGGYAFAWYGRCGISCDGGAGGCVELVASSAAPHTALRGFEREVWSDARPGGPGGCAARAERAMIDNDIQAGQGTAVWRTRAAAVGFHSSASLPVQVGGRTDGVFTVYATECDAFDDHAVAILEDLTRTLGYGIERTRGRDDLRQAFASSIDLVAAVVESRDPYTAGHQALVAELAHAIGVELGLDDHRLEGLAFAARIHDVGKIGVPIDILCRPGVLNPEEMAVVKRHATIGWEIAGHFAWPWPVADIVHQHHERYDGTGYPRGLRGDEILLEARIVSVADAYQAIASRRPYRAALGEDTAYRTVIEGAGSHFDPEVVDAFARVMAGGFEFSGAAAGQD